MSGAVTERPKASAAPVADKAELLRRRMRYKAPCGHNKKPRKWRPAAEWVEESSTTVAGECRVAGYHCPSIASLLGEGECRGSR